MAGRMGNRRPSKGPKFVRLFHFVKLSQAWHDLSLAARCALIELIYRYNGGNNGTIGLGVRQLSDALHCSRDTAARALRELDDSKLAVPRTGGHWKASVRPSGASPFIGATRRANFPSRTGRNAKCPTSRTQKSDHKETRP